MALRFQSFKVVLALAVVASLPVPPAWADDQPPLEIKGMALNASKDQAMAALPGLSCTGESYCSLTPGSYIRDKCGQVIGFALGQVTKDERASQCSREETKRLSFGPVPAFSSELNAGSVRFASVIEYRVRLRDGIVGYVGVRFGGDNFGSFEKVVAALKEKYGQPTKDETVPVQNRAGATFENHVVTWVKSGGTMVATQRSGSIDESSVIAAATWFAEAEARNATEKAKASAKGL